MKLKLISLVLFSTFSLPTAFAAATTDSTTTTNQTTNTTAAQNAQTPQNQKDGEILAILVVLNQNEVAAADVISKKKDDSPAVRKYAKKLSEEHSKNLKETLKLSKKISTSPVQNDTANSLKQKGENELATLNPLTGTALDRAYIDAMVIGHNEAIQLFDNTLIPNATNPKLKEHLTATRKHLVKHLEEAQAIQKKLNQNQTNDASSTSNSSDSSDSSTNSTPQ